MLKVRGLVPLVAALLVVLSAVSLFGFSATLNPIDAIMGRGRVVTVPDFNGRALPGARSEATDLGLEVTTSTAFSLTAPRGSVIGQDPVAGTRLRTGEEIELVVSTGANRIQMPEVVGRPLEEVMVPFDDAGVQVTVTEVPSEDVAVGVVVSQNPAAGVQVTGEDVVALEVSVGPANRPVPATVGLSLEGAAFQLGLSGLLLGEITEVDDPAVVAGAVVSSNPPAATVVARDTPVSLVISNGPAPIAVPDVLNNLEGPATNKLEGAGFVVDVAGRLLGIGDTGKGNVYEQSPAAGTLMRPGEVVTIVVGREAPAPRTTTTTTTTTTTVPPTTTTTRPGG